MKTNYVLVATKNFQRLNIMIDALDDAEAERITYKKIDLLTKIEFTGFFLYNVKDDENHIHIASFGAETTTVITKK